MKHLLLALILCISSATFSVHAADGAEIVVVDIEEVYVGANIFKARYEQLNKELGEAKDGMRVDVDAVRALENQLSITGESSPDYAELSEKIEVGKFKIKLAQKRIQARLQQKNLNLVKDNTADLRKHLKTYCEEKGHKIVIRTISSGLQGETSEQLRMELNSLNTLYASPENDITDDFIGWINAKFPVAAPKSSDADIEVME